MYDDADEEHAENQRRWQAILNSPAIVALLTVVIGGLFTTYITNTLQRAAKTRELAATWLHELAQHRLAAQKSYLDEQWAVADEACKLVGRMRSASMGLLDTTTAEFADKNFRTARQQSINEAQREKLRAEFNAADDAWQTGSGAFDYRLADYPVTSKSVATSWAETKIAVEQLKTCAEARYRLWANTGSINDRCQAEDARLAISLTHLAAAVRLSRSRARWDWENANLLAQTDALR